MRKTQTRLKTHWNSKRPKWKNLELQASTNITNWSKMKVFVFFKSLFFLFAKKFFFKKIDCDLVDGTYTIPNKWFNLFFEEMIAKSANDLGNNFSKLLKAARVRKKIFFLVKFF